MNFISTFDELNKLYEEVAQEEKCYVYIDLSGSLQGQKDELTRKAGKAVAKHYPNCEFEVKYFDDPRYGEPFAAAKAGKSIIVVTNEDYKTNCPKLADFKNVTIINALDEELTEVAEDDVAEDEVVEVEAEATVEEPVADEPKQVICECDKCGALVIKDEADIVIDEESDLVNVEDACQYCEETKGYKIIGAVAPYEAIVVEEPVEDEPVEDEPAEEDVVDESLTEGADIKDPNVRKLLARLRKVADTNGTKVGADNMRSQAELIKKHCSEKECDMLRNVELTDGSVVNMLGDK